MNLVNTYFLFQELDNNYEMEPKLERAQADHYD
jgi:hypothetical protein